MTEKFDILSCSEQEMAEYLTKAGQPTYRAKQVYKWLHCGVGFDEMTNLPKALREYLKENAVIRTPSVEEKFVSKDGTVKYLLRLLDGELNYIVVRVDLGSDNGFGVLYFSLYHTYRTESKGCKVEVFRSC